MQNLSDETEADPWPHIAPLLDDAMAGLSETDRHAVVLRYFDGKSMKEVGAALGGSEDAAKMRVNRAVEKLRKFFAKRGVALPAAALTTAIAAHSVQAAPVGLAAAVTTAALSGTAITTSAIIAATKTIAMTTLQKTLVTVTVAALAGTGIYEARQTAQLREQNQTLQQSQAPLAEQIQQLQHERDETARQLTVLRDDNEHMKTFSAQPRRVLQEKARRQPVKADSDPQQPNPLRENLVSQQQMTEQLTLNRASQLARALISFAEDNQGELPNRLSDMQAYFPNGSDLSTSSSEFEMMVLPGDSTSTPNPEETIILRQKEPAVTSDGRFSKAYAFADGHSQIRFSPTDDFAAYEQNWTTMPKVSRANDLLKTSP